MTSTQHQDSGRKHLTGEDIEKLLERKFEAQLCGIGKQSDFLEEYFRGGDSSDTVTQEAHQFESKGKEWAAAVACGLGGSLRGGHQAACDGRPATPSPPLTNRGVNSYQPDVADDGIPPKCGGYDGGIEIGFDGSWDLSAFQPLINILNDAKEQAVELGTYSPTTLGGHQVLVSPSSAKIGSASISGGLTYKYVFVVDGITFQIHSDPKKGIQPVRIRYGATALIQRDLFELHFNFVLPFLASLGLTITAEKISRLDGQVMVNIPVKDLVIPAMFENKAVTRVRKKVLRCERDKIQTYELGTHGSEIQLVIYDKAAELKKMVVSDPAKYALMVEHCLGRDYSFNEPLTRVEFRVRRDALKEMDINSVQDLKNREYMLFDWLTNQWFRILAKPKVRGHENTTAIHPLWKQVQAAFARWFPGGERKPVKRRKIESVSCDATALLNQAKGCIKKVVALRYGKQKDESQFTRSLYGLFSGGMESMREQCNSFVETVKVMRGILLGDSPCVPDCYDAEEDYVRDIGLHKILRFAEMFPGTVCPDPHLRR